MKDEELAKILEEWFKTYINIPNIWRVSAVGRIIKENLKQNGSWKDKKRGNSKAGKAILDEILEKRIEEEVRNRTIGAANDTIGAANVDEDAIKRKKANDRLMEQYHRDMEKQRAKDKTAKDNNTKENKTDIVREVLYNGKLIVDFFNS